MQKVKKMIETNKLIDINNKLKREFDVSNYNEVNEVLKICVKKYGNQIEKIFTQYLKTLSKEELLNSRRNELINRHLIEMLKDKNIDIKFLNNNIFESMMMHSLIMKKSDNEFLIITDLTNKTLTEKRYLLAYQIITTIIYYIVSNKVKIKDDEVFAYYNGTDINPDIDELVKRIITEFYVTKESYEACLKYANSRNQELGLDNLKTLYNMNKEIINIRINS